MSDIVLSTRVFDSMAAFEANKRTLPRTAIAVIHDGGINYLYTQTNGKSYLQTVGRCAFQLGYSLMGGQGVLTAK